jgi:hypothetical protein
LPARTRRVKTKYEEKRCKPSEQGGDVGPELISGPFCDTGNMVPCITRP